MESRFSISAMETEGRQLLPGLFLPNKWSFERIFRCPRMLNPQNHDQNPAEPNRRVWGWIGCSQHELGIFNFPQNTQAWSSAASLSPENTSESSATCCWLAQTHLQEIFGSRNCIHLELRGSELVQQIWVKPKVECKAIKKKVLRLIMCLSVFSVDGLDPQESQSHSSLYHPFFIFCVFSTETLVHIETQRSTAQNPPRDICKIPK